MTSLSVCPRCFKKAYDGKKCHVCGYEQALLKDALPPFTKLHDRYLLGAPLGQGGFGISYSALDTRLHKRVVIKEYFPKFLNLERDELMHMPISAVTTYNHGHTRFKEEAALLCKLKDYHFHYIVYATDRFDLGMMSYYVMEYVEGISLKKLVKSYHLSDREIKDIIVKIAKELGVVHKKLHILHRDISPDNILIDSKLNPVLIDFGSAKILDGAQGFSVVLKKHYAPLEQYSKAKNEGPYSDVYALAATYYFLLTGHYVIEAPQRAMHDQLRRVRDYHPEVSEQVDEAIMHALMMKVNERTQSMEEFVKELEGRKVYGLVRCGKHCYRMKKYGLSIGRHDDNDLIFKAPSVSKHHMRIRFDEANETFTIEDFSRNGTFVNGHLLSRQSVRLKAPIVINIPGILEEISCEVTDE